MTTPAQQLRLNRCRAQATRYLGLIMEDFTALPNHHVPSIAARVLYLEKQLGKFFGIIRPAAGQPLGDYQIRRTNIAGRFGQLHRFMGGKHDQEMNISTGRYHKGELKAFAIASRGSCDYIKMRPTSFAFSDVTFEGVMLHGATHNLFNTEDTMYVYGKWGPTHWIERLSRVEMMNNADNYRLFYQKLRRKHATRLADGGVDDFDPAEYGPGEVDL